MKKNEAGGDTENLFSFTRPNLKRFSVLNSVDVSKEFRSAIRSKDLKSKDVN